MATKLIEILKQDDNVSVFVRHAREDNGNHLLVVPLMSEAERIRLLSDAMTDLRTRETNATGEDGTIEESAAQSMLQSWLRAHPAIESARVVDGGETWDYLIDVGDRNNTETGKGKAEGADQNGDLNNVDEEFDTRSGEHHKLYVKRNASGAYQIIIESTPTIYEDFVINHFNGIENPSEELEIAKNDALVIARRIDTKLVGLTNGTTEPTPDVESDLDADLSILARETIKLIDASSISPIPEENIVWGGKIGSFGSSMSIKYLKSKTTGSDSSNLPFEENQVLMQRKTDRGIKFYINGHLLNANLHGPNDWKNLTPLTHKANSDHKTMIENPLKNALPTAGNPEFIAFKYVVIPNYSRGVNSSLISQVENSQNDYVQANKDTIIEIIRAERYVPVSLRAESVELEDVNGSWVEKSSGNYNISVTIPNSIGNQPEDYKVTNEKVIKYPVKYSTASKQDFIDAGLSEKTATGIMRVRRNPRLSITNHDILHSELLKVITGSGGRVQKQTLIDKITL